MNFWTCLTRRVVFTSTRRISIPIVRNDVELVALSISRALTLALDIIDLHSPLAQQADQIPSD